MTVYLFPLLLIGALTSCGVYLLLERNLTRILLGLFLISNALNLLLLVAGGPSGNPPIRGYSSADQTDTADPLAQAMILTSIVITMGVAAFVLALTYRSYRLTTADDVADDDEDTRVSREAEEGPPAEIDEDEPVTHPDTDEPDELDALPGPAEDR